MTDRSPVAPNAVTRRLVLQAGGAGVAAFVLAACGSSSSRSASAPPGSAFRQPKVLTSSNRRLEVTLRAEARTVPYGTGRRFAYTYNGTTPGPTLRVRPGDTLVITLENRLDEPTNLHTHGLHVSPEGDSDNIFVQVDPGQSHTYTYVLPSDHRSSLCWYHPHHHGMVAPQLSGGLFGGIIVEDALDQGAEISASTERLLILSDPRIGDSRAVLGVSTMEVMQGREGDAALVNGLTIPTIDAAAGSLERWRILNASASRYYELALDGHRLHVIATDGGRLAAPHPVEEILLAPGERTELLVTPAKTGAYRFRTRGYDRGSAGMGGGGMGGAATTASADQQVLATMVVTGSKAAAALPAQIAAESDLAPGPAQSERAVVLAMGAGRGSGGMGGGAGGGGMMSFTINGQSFDAARTNITTDLDTTEDWVITNTSNMDHPFHLHVWPFRVIDRSSGAPDVPGWKDTVNVPAGSTVTIRVPITDITGRTVYHCHILDHEDQGMMGVIRVR